MTKKGARGSTRFRPSTAMRCDRGLVKDCLRRRSAVIHCCERPLPGRFQGTFRGDAQVHTMYPRPLHTDGESGPEGRAASRSRSAKRGTCHGTNRGVTNRPRTGSTRNGGYRKPRKDEAAGRPRTPQTGDRGRVAQAPARDFGQGASFKGPPGVRGGAEGRPVRGRRCSSSRPRRRFNPSPPAHAPPSAYGPFHTDVRPTAAWERRSRQDRGPLPLRAWESGDICEVLTRASRAGPVSRGLASAGQRTALRAVEDPRLVQRRDAARDSEALRRDSSGEPQRGAGALPPAEDGPSLRPLLART